MLVKDILGTAMVYQTLGQNNVEVFTNKKYKTICKLFMLMKDILDNVMV